MRLLHTSDWHLGRSFHREGLLDAQALFVDQVVATVRAERVDVVVIAGDVFDRALPPVDAVALWDDALTQLADCGAVVVVTSGNHDSARRLGLGARLMRHAGVHLRTDGERIAEPVLLDDRHGPVAVYGLPYLEPDVWREQWHLPERSHAAALEHAMAQVRTDLAGRPGTRSVAIAHAWVTGGQACDSERDITVGGVSVAPASVFDGVDYAALGHLHRRQEITDTVRYSGSPLAYSFSEAGHQKGSWLVELGARGFERADFVAAPVPRQLVCLRGTLEELLSDPAHSDAEDAWVQATMTDAERPTAAMERVRARFPHALVLHYEPVGGTDQAAWTNRVRGRSDRVILTDFVTTVRSTPTADEAALLQAACEACRGDTPDAAAPAEQAVEVA